MHNRIAVFNFDASTIDWPFKRQRVLNLKAGARIQVLVDDGGEWALGQIGNEDDGVKGYFPKNYTVLEEEYNPEDWDHDEESSEQSEEPSEAEEQSLYQDTGDRTVHPAAEQHPPFAAEQPIATSFSPSKATLLHRQPPIREKAPDEGVAEVDDPAVQDDGETFDEFQSKKDLLPGKITSSRASTPATYAAARPERDFVRSHLPIDMQASRLSEVCDVSDLIDRTSSVNPRPPEPELPYPVDMRLRATTCRIAAGIEPPHTRVGIARARQRGARWTLPYRPGLNDIVNETVKMGGDAAILSTLYLYDHRAREQFLRLHIRDMAGIQWHDLQRVKSHLFYMRLDFVDVLMLHPDAWGFPDSDRVVRGNPGEALQHVHGWYSQTCENVEEELGATKFNYEVKVRSLPTKVFQRLQLGKVPDWIAKFTELKTEIDENEKPEWAKRLSDQELLEAGLADDVYVRVDAMGIQGDRTAGPDVLDLETKQYKVLGTEALRIALRMRANPDGSKTALITPKQIKDMVSQLGMHGQFHYYWYALFAMRFPLPPNWDLVVRNETRYYVDLQTGRTQLVHPAIRQFRENLFDVRMNDFLWDFRGFLKLKCSDCGLPDAVVWCQQCLDYFCPHCFLQSHRSKRGRNHWALPLPGCRYLTKEEAEDLAQHIPLLNVGFVNRRRFLARDNQSDKTGSRDGDKWLMLDRDSLDSALQMCPPSHQQLKRTNPPRLAPDAKFFYYNFAHDVVCDDAEQILQRTREQAALLLMQKWVRGGLVRKEIRRQAAAAIVIQKFKRMWDCQRFYGKNGSNARLLRGWYKKFRARQERERMIRSASRIQAMFRGNVERKLLQQQRELATKLQGIFRGKQTRKALKQVELAATRIQRCFRGYVYGRKPVAELNMHAAKLQGCVRGLLQRSRGKRQQRLTALVQAQIRGMLTRREQRRRHRAATKIQSLWRRHDASLAVKQLLFARLHDMYIARKDVMKQKLQNTAAVLIQRLFRRHRAYAAFVDRRREKSEADARISTVVVSALLGCAPLNEHVHPWWRHLPSEIRDTLEQLKGPLQRTLGLRPVVGKLANEEIGKKSRRTKAEDMVLDQGDDIDLASHLLLCIVNHLQSHVPDDQFPSTVRWASFALSHTAVQIQQQDKVYEREELRLGQEVAPRPGDPMLTLSEDTAHIKHTFDRRLTTTDENLHLLFLNGIPAHLRHVMLTAETLVTCRQVLDLPNLSTDDHLTFQGVDATVGAQIQDIISCEIKSRLPYDWVTEHGTVYALATEAARYCTEEIPGTSKQNAMKTDAVAAMQGQATTKLSSFNRGACMRIVQQLAFFMRDQDRLVSFIRRSRGTNDGSADGNVKQSRFVSVVDKLFELANRAKHDHTNFVLATVLVHMIARGLMLRVYYHRACVSVQCRYRYLRESAQRKRLLAPALRIQSHWRAVREALNSYDKIKAVEVIQHSLRAARRKQRNRELVTAVLKLQRVWRGALQRLHLRRCHASARCLQARVRGLLVRVQLDKDGRRVAATYKDELRETMTKNRERIRSLKSEMQALGDEQLLADAQRFGHTLEHYKHNVLQRALAHSLAARACVVGRMRVALHHHRENLVATKHLQSTAGTSRVMRASRKAQMEQLIGSVQAARQTCFEPLCFAIRRERNLQARLAPVEKSAIVSQVENARRALQRTGDDAIEGAVAKNPLARRGLAIRRAKREHAQRTVNYAGAQAGDAADGLIDDDQLDRWETRQFKTSIIWMPKSVASRIVMPHERQNLKSMYLLTTAFVGSFVSRNDDVRPPWGPRVRLLPVSALPEDFKSHLAGACRILCNKVAADASTQPKVDARTQAQAKRSKEKLPQTVWQQAVRSACVVWRALFAVASGVSPSAAVPVLWMSSTESSIVGLRSLLSGVWREALRQFTGLENRYRNLKSRPSWESLEEVEYKALMEAGGFGLSAPKKGTNGGGGAASLSDFMEEVCALRFAIDVCAESLQHGEAFVEAATRRRLKAKAVRNQSQRMQPAAGRGAAAAAPPTSAAGDANVVQSLAAVEELDDPELRSVLQLVTRLLRSCAGPEAALQRVTVTFQLMLAVWKAVQPMIQGITREHVSGMSDALAAAGQLVPPQLAEGDGLHTAAFMRIADSYAPPPPDTSTLLASSPATIARLLISAQCRFRGFRLRRNLPRMRAVLAYCKEVDWPRKELDLPGATAAAAAGAGRKKADTAADEVPEDYQPQVSRYLGGMDATGGSAGGAVGVTSRASLVGSGGLASTSGARGGASPRAPVRITGDHRACADFFAVFVFGMYRRRQMASTYQVLGWAYDFSMARFGNLLVRNPSLRPMVESVAAQLKRGALVGFDKAFAPPPPVDAVPATSSKRPVDQEIFRREQKDATVPAEKRDELAATRLAEEPASPQPAATAEDPLDERLDTAADYLETYLREMDGDDALFRDIESATAIALARGSSPPRVPPAESLLRAHRQQLAQQSQSLDVDDMMERKLQEKPKLTPEFLRRHLTPHWLPVKAHRFAAFRSKILQLLPQRTLPHYAEHERKMNFAACIKLLEAATPGSLNVLEPHTLVHSQPLLVETAMQLVIGFIGLCLQNDEKAQAKELALAAIEAMPTAFRDMHPVHRLVMEAYVYDVALSVAYALHDDPQLQARVDGLFREASQRYLKLKHNARFVRCCIRHGCVKARNGHNHEAEHATQQALQKIIDQPPSPLTVVCYHNLAVLTGLQRRTPDALAHMRAYVGLLKQLPRLTNAAMQKFDDSQFCLLKLQEKGE